MNKSTLEIIIVNWNTEQLLDDCLASVYKNCSISEYKHAITVVDNNSSDNSVNMVNTKYPDLNLIVNDANLGFAKANNIAINASNAEYVLLLNSDTVVGYDIITPAIRHLELNRNVALAGCGLVLKNGKRQVGDAGFKPTVGTSFNFAFFLSKLFPSLFRGIWHNGKEKKDYLEVDWVSGAALFARMDFIKMHGSLSEDYFMYAEDVEWGLRAINNNWKVHYLPQIKVNHYMGASSKEDYVSTTSFNSLNELIKTENGTIKISFFWIFMACGYTIRYLMVSIKGLLKGPDMSIKTFKTYALKSLSMIFKH